MSIDVENEVGRLRRVMIHRPGDEIVRMTQHDLASMLFDDILAPAETQREHDVMTEIMRAAGAEVVQFENLLLQALECAGHDEVRALVENACERAGAPGIVDELCSWPASRLAHAMMAGVYWDELVRSPPSLTRLRDELGGGRPMALRPIPNLMFMRDPC
jgi:arginine deiminase